MAKRKKVVSEPGHKERFDALFRSAVPRKSDAGVTTFKFDNTVGSATISLPGVQINTGITTTEQYEAYMRAVADGTYGGL